ncbi:MAG: T6SS effector amidase Tae4 family protein [Myxococcota bacterium]
MVARLRNFDRMWDAYPAPGGTADEAKYIIGGRATSDSIDNTCVLRISRAFNYSDNSIPRSSTDEILTIKGGDGRNYALRVREFTRYLRRKYGPAGYEHEYPEPGGGEIPASFKGRQGVIIFDVKGWTDATGHIDLWNGTSCRHNGYFHKASTVMLWEVDDTPRPRLGGSVGRGGRNDADDVEMVQQRLADNGVDPGAIDAVVGPKTIAAIRSFQSRFLVQPDGRVDPDGRTWRELLEQ